MWSGYHIKFSFSFPVNQSDCILMSWLGPSLSSGPRALFQMWIGMQYWHRVEITKTLSRIVPKNCPCHNFSSKLSVCFRFRMWKSNPCLYMSVMDPENVHQYDETSDSRLSLSYRAKQSKISIVFSFQPQSLHLKEPFRWSCPQPWPHNKSYYGKGLLSADYQTNSFQMLKNLSLMMMVRYHCRLCKQDSEQVGAIEYPLNYILWEPLTLSFLRSACVRGGGSP